MTDGTAVGDLLEAYQPPSGVYDELLDARGQVRPHWRQLVRHLNSLGAGELQRRCDQAQRQVFEMGVTVSPQVETGELTRPWELDAIPLLIPAAEWKGMEAGLAQRARLFDHVLRDLLGPRELIRQGLVPPEALYAHPAFQLSYLQLHSPAARYLFVYAADLARSPNGAWWVAADRTSAPTGLGYLLENRVITSRILPSAFREANVSRLNRFFATLRETLAGLAPRYRDNPRVVLWTRGRSSPSFFEDAYLSRYLNYTLVESGDLAVRDQRVMLKTLGGLLPVEVILRRVDDHQCDPVELDTRSLEGVPALTDVVRAGNTVLVNPLGCGLVESPVWLPYLPGICRHLFSEELLIPSVATWWCGEPEACAYVRRNLDQLLIRPAFRMRGDTAILAERLSSRAREELLAAIEAHPERYVGQERIPRSTSPVWSQGGPQPWHLALRCFMVAGNDEFEVLPGGLARAGVDAGNVENVVSQGQRNQDVWVLADGHSEQPLAASGIPTHLALRRSGAELPSRVAENFYWLGRNVERADDAVRLLRTVFQRLASDSDRDPLETRGLLRLLAEVGQVEPGFALEEMRPSLPSLERTIPEIVFSATEPQSLQATIAEIVRLASQLRDRIAQDVWRIITRVEVAARRTPRELERMDVADALEVLERLSVELAALAGLAAESMTRTLGWRFLDIGRRIERAWQITSLLRATVGVRSPEEAPLFEALLDASDSLMTYRSRYLANLQAPAVLDLLLTDETNPRSVAYQVVILQDHVATLPRPEQRVARGPEERVALSMLNLIRLTDVYELSKRDPSGSRPALDRMLVRLLDQLPRLSDAISSRFFIHAGLPRSLIARGM